MPTPIPVMCDGPPPALRDLLGPEIEILEWDDSPDSPALARAVGILAYGHPRVDGPMMDRAPNLKVVINHGVGVDHIDVSAAHERKIPVGNTPGCLDASTADMTMALMLAVARNVVTGDHVARSPGFTHYDPSDMIGYEVSGSTLGIIGLGRIGRQVAKRANAFEMKVLYHNRRRDEAAERELGVIYAEFDDLLKQADFVSLNCPLTPETTNLIGTRELGLMKPTGILLNLARGPVVDHDALYAALHSRRIAGAGLDVTAPEPLPRNHPLLRLSNVVITPHLGSATDRTRQKMAEMSVVNLRAGLRGDPLPWPV
ncbi:2-hydroxyacid dehydrogenase [Schlesneria paludicola]|uniref:2-hydroxyacid dehydrogenase n=1 Tax=Schlesneria paludicola TaxID=360056 RepID=UPI00029AF7A7|nr:D-glycerate dehydrogenase [Schlesneria paludicola]